jgi:hypothetical protein
MSTEARLRAQAHKDALTYAQGRGHSPAVVRLIRKAFMAGYDRHARDVQAGQKERA